MPKTFRLFLSSTFGDFQAEREALKEQVWGRLEAYCASRDASFQVVDLRWGISENDGLTHDTLRICLDEIAHCQKLSPKPNFLMLLGNRYGWRPLPPEIPADEFDQIIAALDGPIGKDTQLLKHWYLVDNNALPPLYVLRARGDTYCAYSTWMAIESELLRILRTSATKLDRTPFRNEHYFYSATHQEIIQGALAVGDADQHVFACIRELQGLDTQGAQADRFTDFKNGQIDTEATELRRELRMQIEDRLPSENCFQYVAQWQGQATSPISTEHINQLCNDVDVSLRLIINQELQASPSDKLEQEVNTHRDIGHKLAEIFFGRENQLKQLANDVQNMLNAPACVFIHGPAGVGKSAFMARALVDLKKQHLRAIVIERFIGTSQRSIELFTFLQDLLTEMARRYGKDESLPEGGLQELIEILPERMAWATEQKPFILFVDALDQFNDGFFVRQHLWLPSELPPHVAVVVSVADSPMVPALQQHLPTVKGIRLATFNSKEGEVMLDALLKDGLHKKRRIFGPQKAMVLDAFQHDGRPLYLSLAAVECRRWRHWENPDALPHRLEELIQRYVARLRDAHGHCMVDRALAYLSAARFGVSDEEMRDLLWRDTGARAEFESRKNPDQPDVTSLPSVIWSRIYFDLAPYLVEQGANGAWLYRFYHRVIAQEVAKSNLSDDAVQVHGLIAAYFACQPLHRRDGGNNVPNFRKVSEEPWQRIKAGQLEDAEQLLTDFSFAMAKCEADQFTDLLENIRLLVHAVRQSGQTVSKTLRAWDAFLRNSAHILRRGTTEWPANKILLQLAIEHADDSPVTLAAEQWLRAGDCDWVWIRRSERPQFHTPDPCQMVLEGHAACVIGAQWLPNGHILSCSLDQTLRLWDGNSGAERVVLRGNNVVLGAQVLANDRIVSWSFDEKLQLWEGTAGAAPKNLQGHEDLVNGALVLPDDRILSWSDDCTLRLWDGISGVQGRVLHGHRGPVKGALFLPPAGGLPGRILSWSDDSTLRLWDTGSGDELAVLRGHMGSVNGASIHPDGSILSWSDDGTLRLWDSEGDAAYKVLLVTKSPVKGALLLPQFDGRVCRLLTRSYDNMLQLWDGNSGAVLAVLSGHEAMVNGAQVLPDGRILSWSLDKTLRLWDGNSGVERVVLRGHRESVNGARLLPDGRILSWSDDHTMRLWDGDCDSARVVTQENKLSVKGAQVLPDGRILSWSGDKRLHLWNGNSGCVLAQLSGEMDLSNGGVQLLANGHILAWSDPATYPNNSLRLWDGKSGDELAALQEHDASVNGALALPGSRILSWSDDCTLRLWDGHDGTESDVLEGHDGSVNGATLLQDGRILSWSWDNTLRLWDVNSGVELTVLEGHEDVVEGAQLLEDGRILSWSNDHTLRLWNSESGAFIAKIQGHTATVDGALLVCDGRILTWSKDYKLRLWNCQSDDVLAELKGHTDSVRGAAVLPDGNIMSWSDDKTLRLWDSISGDCLGLLPANWVETDAFPGKWLAHAERGAVSHCGNIWVQAIDRRISIANATTKRNARWQGNAATTLVQGSTRLICAHVVDELVFLETWLGHQRMT